MSSSSAPRRRCDAQPAPSAGHRVAVPRLPPPASFARKLDLARSHGEEVKVTRLPPPAAFARNLSRIPVPSPPKPNPLETQAPPPVQPPSSGPRRRRRRPRRRGRNNKDAPADETRDWAALPVDAISAILRKLDHVEILMGPGQVCRSWRRATRDDPSLWRRIDMRGHADLENYRNRNGERPLYVMALAAIRRAKGQCEAFWAEYAADDDVIRLLGEQAPYLKSLRLIACQDIVEFEEEINKFPLLEELEISSFTNIGDRHVFEEVAKACPNLKHFGLNCYRFYNLRDSDENGDTDSEFRFSKDDEALGIASMHGLRSLQLFGNIFTNKGLTAILDNCTHLESLDIRHCFNVTMDDTLRAKCARIKVLKLPNDSTDDYQYPVVSPIWPHGIESDSDDSVYGGPGYILDSDEYDDYCDPFRYLNGVYESELNAEDQMFLKGVRMLRMLMEDSSDDDY